MKVAEITFVDMSRNFACTSGSLRVTDPCYDTGVWCSGRLDNVRSGLWEAHVGFHESEDWGRRPAYLHVFHVDAQTTFNMDEELDSSWREAPFVVGVDSGQAGFFDHDLYETIQRYELVRNKFYDEVSGITGSAAAWGTHAAGVVATSGYGDGSYRCLYRYEGNAIAEALIVFIEEEEVEAQ